MAWGFLVYYKTNLLGRVGSIFTTREIKEVPYCHIAMAANLLDFLYNQYLAIISGSYTVWGPLSLGFLWLLVTLTLGQGWCSWACFYGGFDNGFSKILKRPPVKLSLPEKLRDFPAGLFLFLILISFTASLPIFCLWLCPLKITTAVISPDTLTGKIQFFIFIILGLLFIVILPLLTRKRLFCSLICPFGAWQSFFGRLNPYRVTIDREKCNQCKTCLRVCPSLAINEKGLSEYKISPYCNRCGECMDACPRKAISFTLGERQVVGAELKPPRLWDEIMDPNVLYTMTGFLIGGVISNIFVPAALLQVIVNTR